jgi:hypothetical protein
MLPSSLRRSLLAALLLVLASGVAPAVSAQSVAVASPAPTLAERRAQFAMHADFPMESTTAVLSRQLRARSASARAEGLQEAIFYASFFSDLIDLDPLIPDLLRVLREDAEPAHRIMATQALCRIGDAPSILTMVRIAAVDPDPKVRDYALLASAAMAVAP